MQMRKGPGICRAATNKCLARGMSGIEIARNCELPEMPSKESSTEVSCPKHKKPPLFNGDVSNVEVALRQNVQRYTQAKRWG